MYIGVVCACLCERVRATGIGVVSCHVVAGNEPRSSGKAASALNRLVISPAPTSFLFVCLLLVFVFLG